MTPAYLSALFAVVLLLVVMRIVVRELPWRGRARPIGRMDAVLVLLGVVGLLVHCLAMFARPFASAIPWVGALVPSIDAMGAASILLFVAPAMLLLVGLRRQWPPVSVAVLLALIVVGVTMYDGGPLRAHLAAIFTAIVVLAAALLFSVSTLGRDTPVR